MSVEVAVVGGSGFIGTHLIKALLSNNTKRIYVFDIEEPKLSDDRIEWIRWDIRNSHPVDERFAGISIVYNLAAVHRTPGHSDHEYYDTNVGGALNVTAFCEHHGIQSVVFTSSIAVYGVTENPLDETSETSPSSAYGKSKLLAEEIHKTWCKAVAERSLVIVRPGVIFGSGENGNFSRLGNALSKRSFVFPGTKSVVKSCGYVKELVRTMDFFLSQNRKIVLYNFSFAERLTIEEICSGMCAVARYKPVKYMLPGKIICAVGEIFSLLEKAGLRTGINSERVKKLMSSTNIVPDVLVIEGYRYKFSFIEAIQDWYEEKHDFS